MAKVELNVVALGDFSSLNSQIKALQTQVATLQKSLAGVGVNSTLAAELNGITAAAKQTILSTGNFTAATVKMSSETEKFGVALSTGKLKLGEYFNIITGRSAAAAAQMKALAMEQTKLQNSVIMADATRPGVFSVFTPKNIDVINNTANATRLATNEANLYSIALKNGSTQLLNWGKNTQWAGRQLTVGLAMPMIMFGAEAVKSFKDVNTEMTRLLRLYGEGLTPPSQSELNQISKQVLQLGKDIASTMGISQAETVKAAANFAAMGRQGQNLLDTTQQTMRLSKLGAVDTAAATNTVVALQNVYKVSTTDLADAVNFLSDIQKQTTMTLGDMTEAIPRVGPIMQQLGGTYKDTAVMLVAMREAGIPAAQAANAVKSAVASMIAPTKAASAEFAQYGINLTSIKTSTQGNPVKMIEALQAGMSKLSPLVKEQLIEKLFGKFQFARVSALLDNFGKAGSQTVNALKIAGASSAELSTLANQEMDQATSSTTAKWQRSLESFKANIVPIGETILKGLSKILDAFNGVSKMFSHLPNWSKTILGWAALGVVLAGPFLMITGLLANFFAYIGKGIGAVRDLFTRLQTGSKVLGEILTPEMIASENAAGLFNKGIESNITSVKLMEDAVISLTEKIAVMNVARAAATGEGLILTKVGATNAVQQALPGFVDGIVPGPGSGKVDSYPAMLAPGEAVIPANTTKKHLPLIQAMMNDNVPGYADGNVSQFRSQYLGEVGSYGTPRSVRGGGELLLGTDYENMVKIVEQVILEFDLFNKSLIGSRDAQNLYASYIGADLAHVNPATWIDGRKVTEPGNVVGTIHPENATMKEISAGSSAELNKAVEETTNNMINGIIETSLSPEQITKAAEGIKLGIQPIEEVGNEVYARILQSIRQKVMSQEIILSQSNIGVLGPALAAEGVMTAKAFPAEAAARNYPTLSNESRNLKTLASSSPAELRQFKQRRDILIKEETASGEAVGNAFSNAYAGAIESAIPRARAIGRAIAEAAGQGVATAQESASPSKVAQKLGRFFGIGYSDGIEETIPEARTASEQLTVATTQAVKQGGMGMGKMGWYLGMQGVEGIKESIPKAIMVGDQYALFTAAEVGKKAPAWLSSGQMLGKAGAQGIKESTPVAVAAADEQETAVEEEITKRRRLFTPGMQRGMGMGAFMMLPMMTSMLPKTAGGHDISGATSTLSQAGMMGGMTSMMMGDSKLLGMSSTGVGLAIAGAIVGVKLFSNVMASIAKDAAAYREQFSAGEVAIKAFGLQADNLNQYDFSGVLKKVGDHADALAKNKAAVDALTQSYIDAKDPDTKAFLDKVKNQNGADLSKTLNDKFSSFLAAGAKPEAAQAGIMAILNSQGKDTAAKSYVMSHLPTQESATQAFLANLPKGPINAEQAKAEFDAQRKKGGPLPKGGADGYGAIANINGEQTGSDLFNLAASFPANVKKVIDGLSSSNQAVLNSSATWKTLRDRLQQSNPDMAKYLDHLQGQGVKTTALIKAIALLNSGAAGTPEAFDKMLASVKGSASGITDAIDTALGNIKPPTNNTTLIPGLKGFVDPNAITDNSGVDPMQAKIDGLKKKYKDIFAQEQSRTNELEKQKKLMDDQNNAAQDAISYATQQTDLQNQIRQAIGTGDFLKANLLGQNLSASTDAYNQKVISNSNTQMIDTGKQLYSDLMAKVETGTALTPAEIKKLKDYNPTLGTYHVGSTDVPGAVNWGTASQMGTTNSNVPAINVVVNANGLSADQATQVAANAVADALKRAGVGASRSGTTSKVGG